MGKVVTGTGIIREALKVTVGEDRYKDLLIYTGKLKSKQKLKVQQVGWANITDKEVEQVVNYIKDNYNKEVEVKTGRSGGRHLEFVTFYI